MRFLQLLSVLLATGALAVRDPSCPPFPSSMVEFSSEFKQPDPPMIKAEYETNFIQHKWNQNLSHVTTGFINNSPSQNFVRVDEAFNGSLASSFFNYANSTKEGLVYNTMTTFGHKTNEPTIWKGFVNSNFPLLPEDILVKNGAVFGGLVRRQFNEHFVAAWNIMYRGIVPVTIYVSNCNIVVGYDYFTPGLRTRVITEYFNIQA
ncbi:hypothetical protein N7448_004864 [Penicillium atrosanguineum]|uniref:Uncharacterized protein n=1 Tax=Penicillium atrosanguineum TaxID=1132637 RepID=A0A9W9U1J2_9EURO|nr:Repair protein Rad1/Rec1/Rad17 [Penicillium atrosanguineum]KAJ5136310.1 hypothetical protein N7448_004864 [Penicillium atrosanguineum]KAJ5292661.1 Repair protein Rad1/Rec1/Rad17 [Penicillium atrosanguineum]KAJ5303314.1 hypothetical protein N7476_010113 [Penicillium atrosanguineum]